MITKKYSTTKGSYKVTFSLTETQVGGKRDVRVLADFNDWSWDDGLKLKLTKGNYSGSAELPAQAARYQFRYLMDGEHWLNDPEADRYQHNIHGTNNCIFELEGVAAPSKKEAPKKAKVAKQPAAKKATAAKPAATKKAAPKKAAPKKAAPAKKTVAKSTSVDDLKRIEGIGPKIEGLLNADGITTFEGLNKASTKKLTSVLDAAGPRFRLAKPDTWKQQAKLAVAGKDAELKKLQAELKGGVKK